MPEQEPKSREGGTDGRLANERQAMRYSLLELPFKVLFVNSVQGTTLVALALWMGAGPVVLSIVASIPFLGNLVSVFGPYALERTGTKRKLTQRGYVLAGTIYLSLPLLVLAAARYPSARDELQIGLILIVLAAEMIRGMADVSYIAWLAEIFPPERRGHYFARRFLVMGIGSIVTSLAIGQYLNHWGKGSQIDPIAFYTLIPVGVASQYWAVWLLRRVPGGVGRDLPVTEAGWKGLLAPFFDPMYRGFLTARALQAITHQLVGPFLVVFMIVDLKMPYAWVFGLQVLYQGTAAIGYRVWEPIVARVGPRKVYIFNSMLFIIYPAFFAAAGFGGLWLLIPAHLFGFFEGGFALSLQLLMMNLAPEKQQVAYLGTANAVTGALFGGATIAGGFLAGALAGLPVVTSLSPIGSGLPALMLLSLILRVTTVFTLRQIKDIPVRPVPPGRPQRLTALGER